ncbi:MAG: hypothetical protein HC890_06955 [Chloroflexaceae bacterium]|nr:hypothetical protein [Chloroflexaceae bacterium]
MIRFFGGQGTDTLLGGGGNDLLVGEEENDILTGGSGGDIFRFTNQGIDSVTDFNSGAAGERFEFLSSTYDGAPVAGTQVVVNTVAGQSATTNIYVDTLANILGAAGNVRFAYATDTDQLLFDADGIWNAGSITIANTNNLGVPLANDFAFV